MKELILKHKKKVIAVLTVVFGILYAIAPNLIEVIKISFDAAAPQ